MLLFEETSESVQEYASNRSKVALENYDRTGDLRSLGMYQAYREIADATIDGPTVRLFESLAPEAVAS